MPTDPYFIAQSYFIGRVMVAECTEVHACCHQCDGCDGGEYADLQGPAEPVQYGPWKEALLINIFKARYTDKLEAVVPLSMLP